jgi:thioredoxin-like negative regulator of GroEL
MVTAYFFTSRGCSSCAQIKPIIKKLQDEGFKIEEINVNQRFELARKYNVSGLPTIVILQDGKEIKRFVGVIEESELRKNLQPNKPDYKIW